jgi:hypothetical protein
MRSILQNSRTASALIMRRCGRSIGVRFVGIRNRAATRTRGQAGR